MDTNTKRLQRFDDELIVKKTTYNKNITVSDIFQEYDGNDQQTEYNRGEPRGREINGELKHKSMN